jgi:serine/threonine protein kinase
MDQFEFLTHPVVSPPPKGFVAPILGFQGWDTNHCVARVRRSADGREYLVKWERPESGDMTLVLQGVRRLMAYRHPRILPCYEVFVGRGPAHGYLGFVLPETSFGTLANKISRYVRKRTYIDERVIIAYALMLLEALQEVHQRGQAHQDVSPWNCHLAPSGALLLSAPPTRKLLREYTTKVANPRSHGPYAAPEMWGQADEVTVEMRQAADVWAVGCVLHELCSLQRLFDGDSKAALQAAIREGRQTRIPDVYSGDLESFIRLMCRRDPAARATVRYCQIGE